MWNSVLLYKSGVFIKLRKKALLFRQRRKIRGHKMFHLDILNGVKYKRQCAALHSEKESFLSSIGQCLSKYIVNNFVCGSVWV